MKLQNTTVFQCFEEEREGREGEGGEGGRGRRKRRRKKRGRRGRREKRERSCAPQVRTTRQKEGSTKDERSEDRL